MAKVKTSQNHCAKTRQKKLQVKNGGFSLVEVVVAMALIVILSFVAFAVCSLSVNVGGKNYVKNYFMTESKNYLSAYFSGNDNYSKAMSLLTGESFVFGEDATVYYSSGFEITTQENSRYKVNLIFGDKFQVKCLGSDNAEIYMVEV